MTRLRGFTLLEMLVVMILLGFVTTLALPAMQRWHDAVQHKAQAAEIIDALRAAGFKAGANRRDIMVDVKSFQSPVNDASAAAGASTASVEIAGQRSAGSPGSTVNPASRQTVAVDQAERLALALPNGWQAERVDDIRFLANGLCRPGSLVLRTDRGDAVRVEVHGPLCGVELAADQDAASK